MSTEDAGNLTPVIDDADGDGFSSCSGDCDDTCARVHPGAAEDCDGLDNDCDGIAPRHRPSQPIS